MIQSVKKYFIKVYYNKIFFYQIYLVWFNSKKKITYEFLNIFEQLFITQDEFKLITINTICFRVFRFYWYLINLLIRKN